MALLACSKLCLWPCLAKIWPG